MLTSNECSIHYRSITRIIITVIHVAVGRSGKDLSVDIKHTYLAERAVEAVLLPSQ